MKGNPVLASFYIVEGEVLYSKEGVGHPDLWKKIVGALFSFLEVENRKELTIACYATDRGRVTQSEDGKYHLFGTPRCKEYEERLKEIFNLHEVKDLDIDFKTDAHYKTMPSDENVLKFAFKFMKDKSVIKERAF